MTTKKTTLELSNKSLAVALILWFLLALTGAHRMYMGKMGSGLSQLMLLIISLATMVVLAGYVLIFIAIMWWLIDVYVIFKFFNSIEGSTNLLSTSQRSEKHRFFREASQFIRKGCYRSGGVFQTKSGLIKEMIFYIKIVANSGD
jgi:TM2 domain-containing membrane protein YozV